MILAPLASGLVIPGLGQIINRQLGKGGLLVAAASVIFVVGLGFAAHQVGSAILEVGEVAQGVNRWQALHQQLQAQGTTWLKVLMGLMVLIWLYGVIDAFRWGRELDRKEKAGASI